MRVLNTLLLSIAFLGLFAPLSSGSPDSFIPAPQDLLTWAQNGVPVTHTHAATFPSCIAPTGCVTTVTLRVAQAGPGSSGQGPGACDLSDGRWICHVFVEGRGTTAGWDEPVQLTCSGTAYPPGLVPNSMVGPGAAACTRRCCLDADGNGGPLGWLSVGGPDYEVVNVLGPNAGSCGWYTISQTVTARGLLSNQEDTETITASVYVCNWGFP